MECISPTEQPDKPCCEENNVEHNQAMTILDSNDRSNIYGKKESCEAIEMSIEPSSVPATIQKSNKDILIEASASDHEMQESEQHSSKCTETNQILITEAETDKNSILHQPEMALSHLSHLNLEKGNFFKGCKWAPDGLCLMTCSDDNIIRLVNTPIDVLSRKWDSCSQSANLEPCLHIREAEIIYDFAWWPLMDSMQPNTCCFVTTAKDQPIHLWDAFNGELRASYIAKNNVDEVAAAHCINFSPDGIQMISGFRKDLRLFYIDRPGTTCEVWPTRKNKKADGQKGILSTCEFSPDASVIACGSYDGTVALYSPKNGDLVGIFDSNSKGVTHIRFSPDGNRLYSGSRMGDSIICWDIRYTGQDLFHMNRKVETNQRIYFDLGSKSSSKREHTIEDYLVSGGSDGTISFWDLPVQDSAEQQSSSIVTPSFKHLAHQDCMNGVDIHPFLPVAATSSGQRHFENFFSSDDSCDSDSTEYEENSLKLWHISGWEL